MNCLSLLLFLCCLTTNIIQIMASENKSLSIRLCCNPSEFVNTKSHRCEKLPTNFSLSTWEIKNFWSTGVTESVNILTDLKYSVGMFCKEPFVYKFFEYKNDSEHCYSPYYHEQRQEYIIATLDCDFTAKVYIFIFNTYIFGIAISSIFSLLTLIIHMKHKDLSYMMHWKLILSYMISWVWSHLLVIICICLMFTELVPVLWFCFTSSRLWLSVMGYEVWLHFMYSFKDYDLDGDRRRFIVYSLCVWGVALISTLSSWISKDLSRWETWSPSISPAVMLALSLVVFAYIVYKLFVLRLKVVDTEKGKHFLRKSILFLLAATYLMILSWIIFLLWILYPRNIGIVILFYINLILEGPILFAIFVTKRHLPIILCCRRSDCRNLCGKKNSSMEEMEAF